MESKGYAVDPGPFSRAHHDVPPPTASFQEELHEGFGPSSFTEKQSLPRSLFLLLHVANSRHAGTGFPPQRFQFGTLTQLHVYTLSRNTKAMSNLAEGKTLSDPMSQHGAPLWGDAWRAPAAPLRECVDGNSL